MANRRAGRSWSSRLCPGALALLTACASAGEAEDGLAGDDDLTVDGALGAPDAALDEPADGAVEPTVADASAAEPDAPSPDAAPPDAAPPDAAPPDAAPPDACVPGWISLLDNGGFDGASTAPWTQTPTNIISAKPPLPFNPYSGTRAAWLGGGNGNDDTLVQDVVVPAGATALRVRAVECFVTSNAAVGADAFAAELRTPGGALLETVRSATSPTLPTVCSWTAATWTAAAPHAGQAVRLALRAQTDGSYPTSFYLDDLAFEAWACP